MSQCDNIPTLQQLQDVATNSNVLNESVTSDQDLTPTTATDGERKKTLTYFERQYNESIQAAGGVPLGTWAAGVTYNAYNEYLVYNGIPYKPAASTSLPYTTQGSDPTVAPDVGNAVPFTEVQASDLVTVREDLLGYGTQLYMGDDGESVRVGDIVPAETTHLRVDVDGIPALVTMSPVASGSVTALSDSGATIDGNDVVFLPFKRRVVIPSNGADAAKVLRDLITSGFDVEFETGVHYFKSTVTNGDGREVFAELPNFLHLHTRSKNTEFRPTVSAYAYFTPRDVEATDIYFDELRAFGVAEGVTTPRLVSKFLAARDGDTGRLVRLRSEAVETVDFDQGVDTYSWSSNFTNTDSGFCDVGYNFRVGEVPPTSLRLIGAGATSCGTSFNIERVTYATMLNCFTDDADTGVVIKQGKNVDIINHGFEYCPELFRLGQDDYTKLSVGLNIRGAFVFARVRKGEADEDANYADWAAVCNQLRNSTLDFSGIDNDWFTRNKKGFLYIKNCFKCDIDGMPREQVYVDPDGSSTYDDLTAGSKTFNLISDFYVSSAGSDENNGEQTKPLLTFDKVDFALGDSLLLKRKVWLVNNITTPFILRNMGWRKSSQGDDNTPRLVVEGGSNAVGGMKMSSVFGNLNDVKIDNLIINGGGHISDCTGIELNNITVPAGTTLSISGGNITINNSNIFGTLFCQRGAQVRITNPVGSGVITSSSATVYASNIAGTIVQNKTIGGQIFT